MDGRRTRVATVLVLALVCAPEQTVCEAQTYGGLAAGYSALRDELNVGLVYHGAELGGQIGQRIHFGVDELRWEAALGLAFLSTRGMPALELRLTPVTAGYLWGVVEREWRLWLGPALSANYRWYLNPMLQSGSFFWYTRYDVQLWVAASIPYRGHGLKLELRTALLAAASRPDAQPDPYFYDWGLGDLIASAHGNMVVALPNRVQHLRLVAEWRPPDSSLGVGYELVYDGYRAAPALQALQHLVRLTWH